MSFLVNEVLGVVREKNSAKDLWKALENTFATSSYSLIELAELEMKHAKTQYEFLRQSLLALQEIA